MEDSFRTRVDRTFGVLLGSNVGVESESTAEQSESSTAAAEFWSVSERAVSTERFARTGYDDSGGESDDNTAADYQRFVRMERSGRRRRRDDFAGDEPQDEDSDDERREPKRRREEEYEGGVALQRTDYDDEDDEVREMRRMIGRDCTLDFEEEEDEYDKVAVGREGAGERMYMREIRASCLDTFHLPPGHSGPLGTFKRDSRANHAAAAARLKEDKEAEARSSSTAPNGDGTSSHEKLPSVSSIISCLKRRLGDDEKPREVADDLDGKNKSPTGVLLPVSGELASTKIVAEACEEGSGRDDQPENDAATRGPNFGSVSVITDRKEKRARTVRFAVVDDLPEEKIEREAEIPTEMQRLNRISNHDRVPSSVPDHVRNPSKYTHYTLEWSDDEDDNKKNLSAFQSFKREAEKTDVRSSAPLPQSITFNPKVGGTTVRASGNGVEKSKKESSSVQVQPPVSFAEAVVEDELSSKTSEESVSWNRLSEGKTTRIFRKRASKTSEDVDNEERDPSSS